MKKTRTTRGTATPEGIINAKQNEGASALLAVAEIGNNPWQPRSFFSEHDIAALAANISEFGLIQPIAVRRANGVAGCHTPFQLVAGARRLLAHKHNGQEHINAFIIDVSDFEMAAMALAENIARKNLADFEIGKAIRKAEHEFPNKKKLAEMMGFDRRDMYRFFDFEHMPDFVISALEVNPYLISRATAHAVRKVIAFHGDEAIDALTHKSVLMSTMMELNAITQTPIVHEKRRPHS